MGVPRGPLPRGRPVRCVGGAPRLGGALGDRPGDGAAGGGDRSAADTLRAATPALSRPKGDLVAVPGFDWFSDRVDWVSLVRGASLAFSVLVIGGLAAPLGARIPVVGPAWLIITAVVAFLLLLTFIIWLVAQSVVSHEYHTSVRRRKLTRKSRRLLENKEKVSVIIPFYNI